MFSTVVCNPDEFALLWFQAVKVEIRFSLRFPQKKFRPPMNRERNVTPSPLSPLEMGFVRLQQLHDTHRSITHALPVFGAVSLSLSLSLLLSPLLPPFSHKGGLPMLPKKGLLPRSRRLSPFRSRGGRCLSRSASRSED